MESRKVQRVGYSTLSVSLPKDWAKNVDLKPGDRVTFLPQKDGSLKLMPSAQVERKVEKEEFVLNSDLCDEPGMLERLIVGNYLLGRDTLRVVSSKRILGMHVEEVRGMTHRLFGLGIVEETPNQIILQCSIDPTKFKIDVLMRRLSIIASTILTEATQALVEFDLKLAQDAIRREDEADMVYWLAVRLLLSAQRVHSIAEKIGLEDPLEIPDYILILRCLELIADYAQNVARRVFQLVKYKETINKQAMERITGVSELAHSMFQKAMDCIFTGDIKIANGLLEMRKLVKMEEEELMRELPEIPHLRVIASDLTRIVNTGAVIAAIAINRALEKPSKMCSAY